MLASVCKCALSALLEEPEDERCCGGEVDDCGDEEGIAIRASHCPVARVEGCRMLAFRVASDSTQIRKTNCAYCRRYMSVAKARAQHGHNSGPLQVSKARLEVRDFPTDGEGQGSSQ
jgi:hypothetical protein